MPWPPSNDLLAPLAAWFDRVRRDLPWRAPDLDGPHPDPYAVLVSELMLQQTQVATVIPYYTRWMARFPTARDLGAATEEDVHKLWEGLGYYRRARYLQAAAATVAAEGWPGDLAGLTRLPGLGPYSAAAVGAIAFQWPTPALDGNAFRVLARLLLVEGDPKAEAGRLRPWLAPALTAGGPSRMTQGLMELGATICQPLPDCGSCPLATGCGARGTGRTADIPPVVARAKPKETDLWLVALEAEGHFLLHPPAARGLLAGLWRWPTLERDRDLMHQPAPGEPGGPPPGTRVWPGWLQTYTHRRERIQPLQVTFPTRFAPAPDLHWVPQARLTALPLGKRDQRLRELLGTAGMSQGSVPVPPEAAFWLRACGAPAE